MRLAVLVAMSLAVVACASPGAQPKLDPISAEEALPLFLFSHVQSSVSYDGHGFVLAREGKRALGVTAFHVAGPIEPPSSAPVAWLRSIVDQVVVVRLGDRLPVAGARTIDGSDSQHDVAAYAVVDFIPEPSSRPTRT